MRYYLLREGVYGHDWDFTDRSFLTRYNADLANDLGNLVSRSLTMVAKFCDGKVPPRPSAAEASAGVRPPDEAPNGAEFEIALQRQAATYTDRVMERYEALDFSGALGEIWAWISDLNQRIVVMAPWTMAKDPARRSDLDDFLYRLLEAIRITATLVSPVMPAASARIRDMLGVPVAATVPGDLAWGRLDGGAPLGRITPLFPRVDRETTDSPKENTVPENPTERPEPAAPAQGTAATSAAASTPTKGPQPASAEPAAVTGLLPAHPVASSGSSASPSGAGPSAVAVAGSPADTAGLVAGAPVPPTPSSQVAPAAAGDKIDIAEFGRVELRVARIVEAEKVKGSKKLLRLQVDLGSERRQVVAGIADSYEPEALVGKTIALVANLKPAKLMGVESNGMVLAASPEGKAILCTFDGDVAPGTKIR